VVLPRVLIRIEHLKVATLLLLFVFMAMLALSVSFMPVFMLVFMLFVPVYNDVDTFIGTVILFMAAPTKETAPDLT
jgi:hypothetical protein